jgi:hypothetical protein
VFPGTRKVTLQKISLQTKHNFKIPRTQNSHFPNQSRHTQSLPPKPRTFPINEGVVAYGPHLQHRLPCTTIHTILKSHPRTRIPSLQGFTLVSRILAIYSADFGPSRRTRTHTRTRVHYGNQCFGSVTYGDRIASLPMMESMGLASIWRLGRCRRCVTGQTRIYGPNAVVQLNTMDTVKQNSRSFHRLSTS